MMLNNLEIIIKYKFHDIRLLKSALTHSSVHLKKNDNERMEFLGDKILGFIIARLLYANHPNKNEGYLSKELSYLTSKEVLVQVANKLNLVNYLNFKNILIEESMLADAMEAIIAAIFLDSNINQAQKFVEKEWLEYITNYSENTIYSAFNPKAVLQDWAQKNKLPIPQYVDIKKEGDDHNPKFYIKVHLEGFNEVVGEGKNKKIAQKNAAEKFISLYKIV